MDAAASSCPGSFRESCWESGGFQAVALPSGNLYTEVEADFQALALPLNRRRVSRLKTGRNLPDSSNRPKSPPPPPGIHSLAIIAASSFVRRSRIRAWYWDLMRSASAEVYFGI